MPDNAPGLKGFGGEEPHLPKPSIEKSSQEQIIDQINAIKSKPTNYIFLFGSQGVGKTAVTSSLIYHLAYGSNLSGELIISRSDDNSKGEKFAREIQRLIDKGTFPSRTTLGTITEVDLAYQPHDPTKKKIHVTLLEMSGENLKEVGIEKSGKLSTDIDVFFMAGNISMLFLLVTDTDVTKRKDASLFSEFLDYIVTKNPKLRDSNMALVITKWDKVRGAIEPSEFVKRHLWSVYNKIYRPESSKNVILPYSVGDVVQAANDDYIQHIDHGYPETLWNWIYETIAGVPLKNPPPQPPPLNWWQKLRKSLLGR